MPTATGSGVIRLATSASHRILAWPRYDSSQNLQSFASTFGPALINRSDVCLCLRHDPAEDIAIADAARAVDAAFTQAFGSDADLQVLIVDDAIDDGGWAALGRQVTGVLDLPGAFGNGRSARLAGTGHVLLRSPEELVRVLGGKVPEQRPPASGLLYPHRLEIIGGKLVCLDLIPEGSTIISAGIGNDVAFERELIKRKNTLVVGLDPTTTAEKYMSHIRQQAPELDHRFVYLKKALNVTNDPIKLYYGENDFMSSVSAQHRDTRAENFFVCEAVTVEQLLNEYRNTSYLKIDIEGAEYPILERMARISVPQISIEFHHHCSTEYALPQTIALIQKIVDMGYDAIDYGAFHGAERKLPEFVSRWSDLNCELLFIRK